MFIGSVAAQASAKTTRAERVRVMLAEEIVAGKLPAGARLDEVEQARRFGVSRTPVREAFRELAALGLVETRPHRGVFVAPSSRDLVRDLFEASAQVMALCARMAVGRMSDDQIRALADAQGDDEVVGILQAVTNNSILGRLAAGLWQRVRPFCPSDGSLADFARLLSAGKAEQAAEAVMAAMMVRATQAAPVK